MKLFIYGYLLHIRVGGALQRALSSVDQTATTTHQLIVDDGVYTPISFTSDWFNTLKNKNFLLSSINGPDNCIIDGGARWVDDNCLISSNLISGGTRCVYAGPTNPTTFGLSFYGFTLSNGYSDSGSAVYLQARGSQFLENCKIHNCYATNGCAGVQLVNICRLCEFDRLRGTRAVVGQQIYNGFLSCEIKNVIAYKDNNSIAGLFESSMLKNCLIYNINFHRSIASYSNYIYQSIFYNLSVGTRYSTENLIDANRSPAIVGNTFIYPNTVTATININNSYNGSGTRIVANNIFAIPTGRLYGSVANQTMSVFNNFCRYVNDTSCYNTITGTDPGFFDAANNDYHLAASSPCISAGNWSLKQNSRDLDGKLYKNPPSIGCYQYYRPIKGWIPTDLIPFGNNQTYVKSYENEILDYINGTKRIYVPVSIQQKLRSLHKGAFYHVGITNQRLDFPNLTRMDAGMFSANATPNLNILRVPNITVMNSYTYYQNASGKTFNLIDVSNVQTINNNFVRYATVKYWYFGNRTRTDLPAFASGVTLAVDNANSGLNIAGNYTKIVLPDAMYDTWISTSPWSSIASSYYMTKTEYDALGLNY